MNQSNKFTFCLNYFGKKRNNLFHMLIFFFCQNRSKKRSLPVWRKYKDISLLLLLCKCSSWFSVARTYACASLNTSKKIKDKFTFWTFFVGYNTLNLQSIFITITFLTQMTYCWSKGEDLQHFMELTKIYFQYLISTTAIAEIIEVWVIYFEYDEET